MNPLTSDAKPKGLATSINYGLTTREYESLEVVFRSVQPDVVELTFGEVAWSLTHEEVNWLTDALLRARSAGEQVLNARP